MKKKYRPLNKEEMSSLKDKWLIFKKTNVHLKIISFDFKKGDVYISDNWETLDNLLKYYTYEDGSPIGIEEELSADGLTLEEFLKKVKGNFENVEAYCEDCWGKYYYKELNNTYAENKNFIISKGLQYYRIKPTPKVKYIRPKPGFRGSVFGEARDMPNEGWKKIECVAVKKNDSPYSFVTLIENFNYFRTPKFSKDNPPQPGTRFAYNRDLLRFDRTINQFEFKDEQGNIYGFDSVNWKDFEFIGEDDE